MANHNPTKTLLTLKQHFGYDDFRPGQEQVIAAILDGRDCVCVMPTGGGKSLCFQVPALLLDGLTLVISPLISLMKDQVDALVANGIAAACLNSSQTMQQRREVLASAASGQTRIIYIAPERLQAPEIVELVSAAGTQGRPGISLVAVDEAHCVSQWGHDFRPSYLQVAAFVANLACRPTLVAFTATATPAVRSDIVTMLKLHEPFELVSGFDRPNIHFVVNRKRGKEEQLLSFLQEHKSDSGIVYCSTRNTVTDVCELLLAAGYAATRYHAGLEKQERHANQEDFLYDRRTIMVATNAFGMGIDKSNVSYVVHYNMPKNLEAYYQEAGRAGRDGSPAIALLLYAPKDVNTAEYLITRGAQSAAGSTGERDTEPLVREQRIACDLELLKKMTFYATTNDCLRHYILNYFGEQTQLRCENCSNCETAFESVDATVEAQKIISCVYRLNERQRSVGKVMLCDILVGSKNQKLMTAGYETLSTYGIMAQTAKPRVRAILDNLVSDGYLQVVGTDYPVLQWSSTSRELLGEEAAYLLKVPKVKAKAQLGQGSQQGAERSAEGDPAELRLNQEQMQLFEQLRILRRTLAEEAGLPAYVIFHDRTLREMAICQPQTEADLLQVSGIGQTKLEKYGASFLQLLRDDEGGCQDNQGSAEKSLLCADQD